MRGVALAYSLVLLMLPVLSGCANNPLALQSENSTLKTAQATLTQRNLELQSRATTLDHDNQELETLLAQTRQQSKVLEDQLVAVRDQLATASTQVAQLRNDKQLTEKQTEALMASSRRKTGAQITANNSLARNLPGVNLPGVEVRPDGDVVRIELPVAKLFAVGNTMIQPSAGSLIDAVSVEVARAYPDHKIGVEGHTDSDFVRNAQGLDNQQISVARATALYMYLAARGTIKANQLFIVGHGGNEPVVSNATATGKARNNRVELVIYPERVTPSR